MKKMFPVLCVFAGASLLVPQTLYAAACTGSSNICDLVDAAGYLVSMLTGILAALAVLVFFWGLVRYIWAAGNAESKDSGKKIMLGGIIALFVMFSIFGIIFFLRQSLGISNIQNIPPPRVTPF